MIEKRIIKNTPVRLEFGDYGNFSTLIPLLIVNHNSYGKVVVKMGYSKNDGRTINLCFDKDEIDYESFEV